jgi:cytochrome c biogenesis factor
MNLVWLGCILMVAGTWIATVKRFKENVRYAEKQSA